MNLRLKLWQKLLLTAFCFGIAIIGFIIKLPSAFRGFDRELHATFYFCAAAFLNILFAKRNIIIHALIFGGLYLFGMAIEHAQVFSKKRWQIPHGRYDPEDVQGNLNGLMLFSAIWLVYIAVYYLTKKGNQSAEDVVQPVATEELIYEDNGHYYLLDYSPGHSELVIRSRNNMNPDAIFNIDLFFKAVDNIQLPTKIDGIKIFNVARKHAPVFKTNKNNRNSIYRIEDSYGNSAYIDASVFAVFHNNLEALQTSLGDFTCSENNKQIFTTTTAAE